MFGNYWNRRQLEAIATGTNRITVPIPKNGSNLPSSGDSVIGTNSIRLNSSASTLDNFYIDYDIILEKSLPDGTTYSQRKSIESYNGGKRTAIIEGVWDIGFEPETGDTYKIVHSYQDKRVSINTVVQTLDYITSKRYGRNLDIKDDLKLDRILAAARKADARSDVSLKLTSQQQVFDGAVYTLTEGTDIIWEGEVRTGTLSKYILFTNIIGKITNRWNSWKSYSIGQIVYNNRNFYKVTSAGVKTSAPVHEASTSNGLQHITSLSISKLSGQGPTTLNLDLSSNPVVALNEDGEEISGYTLYDSDSITYWRHLGWDEHSQDSATLYQTNFTIDTSNPMFDNINMMLEHCNGIFSYSQGKYSLDIEQAETEFTLITEGDIIGKIKLSDNGSRSAFNTVTVSYFDPANNFESRNVSLFSNRYLKQDRNIPKKGNITVVGMTNYYNVRLLADTYLKKSRHNTPITITLYPEFQKLIAGSTIAINSSRYSWVAKKFRVKTMTLNVDGTVDVVAEEYSDEFYNLTNLNKTEAVGDRSAITYSAIPAPTNVKATNTANSNELTDGILVTWDNAPGLTSAVDTEVYASDTSSTELIITDLTTDTVTFASFHGLQLGSSISAVSAGNGIIKDQVYFVKEVVSSTEIKLSNTINGDTIALTPGTGRTIRINPFRIVGSVPYPEGSYFHVFPNIVNNTVKHYKVRYKTQK